MEKLSLRIFLPRARSENYYSTVPEGSEFIIDVFWSLFSVYNEIVMNESNGIESSDILTTLLGSPGPPFIASLTI